MLKKITESPYLNLVCGIILFVTSGYETWIRLEEHAIGVRHGILFFSFVQILKSIPEVAETLLKLKEVKEGLDEVVS